MVSSKKNPQERRRDPRLDNTLPLKIYQEDGAIVTQTANISRSGAYCKVDKRIEPMTKMKVQLLVPVKKGESSSKKISCEGVVVRVDAIPSEAAYNIAIFFHDISQRDSELIADFITQQMDAKK